MKLPLDGADASCRFDMHLPSPRRECYNITMNSRGRTAVAAFFLSLPSPALSAPWPGDGGTDITGDLPSTYEPSGIIWHDRLETLFLVHDKGWVARLESDGTFDAWNVGGDLEALAVADPSSDYLYLGVEQPNDSILEFRISTGTLTEKSWDLTPWMTGPSNSGLEALTFVPDGHHPYGDGNGQTRSGGLFYAGLQEDGTSPYDGRVYVFDVDLSTSGEVDYVVDFSPVSPPIKDLSDMWYDTGTRTLYLLHDGANTVREMLTDNTLTDPLLVEYALPGTGQEGVAFVRTSPAEGYLYITDDSLHKVIRYGGYPVLDADEDGLSDAQEYWHDGAAGYTAGSDTDPEAPDTDLDSFTDYVESQSGTDPLDDGDAPACLRINFQPFALPPPAAWCLDAGTAAASTGCGW
ncbi:MAG: hypothetical protein IT574_11360 [Candidatus Aureabacteria bacterium]|nr:hypothetical protein [Candidatus Auribacterota bacterium]